MNRPYDALLAGYYGFGNLGDELLARASIELLLSAGVPRERIAILSNAPEESEAALGVRALDRWRLSAAREALARSRTLLLGGGGLFQDATSLRSCAYYWGLVRLARTLRCRVWAAGQSVGPLLSPVARWMARTAFAGCAYAGVRDEGSREILTGFGLGCELSPDLTFALDVPPARGRGRTILVNARPAKGRWGELVARAAARLHAEGFPLRGVAFAPEDAAELERRAGALGLPLTDVAVPATLEAFLTASEDARAAVGMRLHFGVLSLRRGLAVAMAPYDPKVSAFARAWEIPLLSGEEKGDDSVIMRLLWDDLPKAPPACDGAGRTNGGALSESQGEGRGRKSAPLVLPAIHGAMAESAGDARGRVTSSFLAAASRLLEGQRDGR